jgi:hypothetical protein
MYAHTHTHSHTDTHTYTHTFFYPSAWTDLHYTAFLSSFMQPLWDMLALLTLAQWGSREQGEEGQGPDHSQT